MVSVSRSPADQGGAPPDGLLQLSSAPMAHDGITASQISYFDGSAARQGSRGSDRSAARSAEPASAAGRMARKGGRPPLVEAAGATAATATGTQGAEALSWV